MSKQDKIEELKKRLENCPTQMGTRRKSIEKELESLEPDQSKGDELTSQKKGDDNATNRTDRRTKKEVEKHSDTAKVSKG